MLVFSTRQVFAVLFDTFVVRSFLVPTIMDLLGDWNWWPTKMPPAPHAHEALD